MTAHPIRHGLEGLPIIEEWQNASPFLNPEWEFIHRSQHFLFNAQKRTRTARNNNLDVRNFPPLFWAQALGWQIAQIYPASPVRHPNWIWDFYNIAQPNRYQNTLRTMDAVPFFDNRDSASAKCAFFSWSQADTRLPSTVFPDGTTSTETATFAFVEGMASSRAWTTHRWLGQVGNIWFAASRDGATPYMHTTFVGPPTRTRTSTIPPDMLIGSSPFMYGDRTMVWVQTPGEMKVYFCGRLIDTWADSEPVEASPNTVSLYTKDPYPFASFPFENVAWRGWIPQFLWCSSAWDDSEVMRWNLNHWGHLIPVAISSPEALILKLRCLGADPSVIESIGASPTLPTSVGATPSLPDSIGATSSLPGSIGASPSLPGSINAIPEICDLEG